MDSASPAVVREAIARFEDLLGLETDTRQTPDGPFLHARQIAREHLDYGGSWDDFLMAPLLTDLQKREDESPGGAAREGDLRQALGGRSPA